jgi:hypothetical protein
MENYPSAASLIKLLFKVLYDFEDVAGYTPAAVGQSDEWSITISSAGESCKN